MFKTLLLSALLLFVAMPPALSQTFDDGLEAYKRKDYAAAYRIWEKLGEAGDEKAQFRVGLMFRYGRGVRKDNSRALYWYQKAALRGYAPAQSSLGVLYRKGEGLAQDEARAAYWYDKAARQGNMIAQYNLGGMFILGLGVKKNVVRGYMWRAIAAARGDKYAERSLPTLEKRMTQKQIAEGKALAAKCRTKLLSCP